MTNFLIVFVWVLSHFALGSQNQQGFRYRLRSLRHLFFFLLFAGKLRATFSCTQCQHIADLHWVWLLSISDSNFLSLVPTIFCWGWFFCDFALLWLSFSFFNNNYSSVSGFGLDFLAWLFFCFLSNIFLGQNGKSLPLSLVPVAYLSLVFTFLYISGNVKNDR